MGETFRENRRHARKELRCPLTVFNLDGEMLGSGDTINISNGGALLAIPAGSVPEVHAHVDVTFFVPRDPPQTDRLDAYATRAEVLRHEASPDAKAVDLAIRFAKPVHLSLRV